jgi:hypothetical protein
LIHKDIHIRKASGELEIFDSGKLEASLHNSGASRSAIKKVIIGLDEWLVDGVSTKKLYSKAFSLLRKAQRISATRYKLKKAIYELGPSGYPFEAFIGEIFERLGYETEVGVIVDGHCLSHEMDVIATKEGEQHIMECKYHKDQGKTVSIQVPLYVKSRVEDIIYKRSSLEEYHGFRFNTWIVTNTRFSADSIQYARCARLNLLAWDYPHGRGLKDLIEQVNIFPITILTNLLKKEKLVLLEKGIVTCRQLNSDMSVLEELNLSKRKKRELTEELEGICS